MNAKAEYLDAAGQMVTEIDSEIKRLSRKRDILKIHIAEAMRGLDEFQSDSVVIKPKDFSRKPLSPSKRREMRRKQSYMFGDY